MDAARIGHGDTEAERIFRQRLPQDGTIIEVGTRRWDPEFPTHHRPWAPEADWILVDAEPGLDVDVTSDAHQLAGFATGAFDAYVAVSLFEHLERPWRAMDAAARVLRPGGLLYVATHQTFPLHGYPRDYFRFSREALEVLARDAGLTVLCSSYAFRARIVPPPEVVRWNTADDVESWLNVDITATKP